MEARLSLSMQSDQDQSCSQAPVSVSTASVVKLFCREGVVYLASPGRPTDIGLQLGKACYPCSR